MSKLEYVLSVENIEISLYTLSLTVASTLNPRQFSQSLEISKQVSFFLEELNKLFRENWSQILTAGYLFENGSKA